MWEGFHERGQVLTRDKRVYNRNGVRFDLDGKLSQWQRAGRCWRTPVSPLERGRLGTTFRWATARSVPSLPDE
jgi:hypothetical protein